MTGVASVGAASTHRRRRLWAALFALVCAAGCLWQDAVVETRPVQPQRPPDSVPSQAGAAGESAAAAAVPAPPASSGPSATAPPAGGAAQPAPPAGGAAQPAPTPSAGGDEQPAAATGGAPEPVRAGPVAGQDVLPKTEVVMLPGGLLLLAPAEVPALPDAPAMLRLTLPVGTNAGKPGLAELAAEVVAELKLPSRPGGSLRGALLRVGASLEVRVTEATTSFDVVFPAALHREVLTILASHLAQPLDPGVQNDSFDTLRVGLASRLGRAWMRTPLLAMVDRIRTGRTRALAEIISQINLRTASEVAVFQRARHRAAGAVLALWVPGVNRAELALGAAAALPPWLDVRSRDAKMPLLTPSPPQAGVFWGPYDGPVEVAVLLPRPSLDQPLAAEMLVLLECLTEDGLGGRLGLALEGLVGRDVAFDVLAAGETDQIALLARADDDIVVPLWEAVSQVRNSFRLRPPVDAELRRAAARARFRLLEQIGKPDEWLRAVSRLAYRRAIPDVFAETLARLAAPTKLDLSAAIPTFCDTPVALGVVGGKPPVESSRLVQLVTDDTLPREGVSQLLPPDDLAAGRAEADKYLAVLVEALGGKAVLRDLRGYREVVRSETGVGPSVETETVFRADGRMRQTTRVLATTITTVITAEGGSEVAGTQQIPIAVDEARSRLAAAARHPTFVVARWLRGEIAFRLVALRLVAGREQAVLEEISDGPDTVRLTIDTEAGLVRAQEVRTWNAEVGAIVVVEEFADYRTINGRLRVPFLRLRSLDESAPTQRLLTLEFDPAQPSDTALR